jgi:hypothetical protein
VGDEMMSDLRRATGVQRRQYHQNLAVTITANDGWKTSHRTYHEIAKG